jgi:hypothetical protein
MEKRVINVIMVYTGCLKLLNTNENVQCILLGYTTTARDKKMGGEELKIGTNGGVL